MTIQRYEPRSVMPNEDEVLRYLGYERGQTDEALASLYDACLSRLLAAAKPQSIHWRLPVERSDEGELRIGTLSIRSHALSKCLAACDEAFLMAATLGVGVDRLLAREEARSPSAAVVTDALASAMIESVCDALCKKLSEDGYALRPRFSPGYGDLPLDCQSKLLSLLGTPSRIGLSHNDSMMMTPTKSVSAIVGILQFPKEDRS